MKNYIIIVCLVFGGFFSCDSLFELDQTLTPQEVEELHEYAKAVLKSDYQKYFKTDAIPTRPGDGYTVSPLLKEKLPEFNNISIVFITIYGELSNPHGVHFWVENKGSYYVVVNPQFKKPNFFELYRLEELYPNIFTVTGRNPKYN